MIDSIEPERDFERARRIADTVLYEGYVLYPYRASARKNRFRWAFGVLAPRAWSEAGGCEAWWMKCEFLVESAGLARIAGRLRFLQIARREVQWRNEQGVYEPVDSLEVDGRQFITWEEG